MTDAPATTAAPAATTTTAASAATTTMGTPAAATTTTAAPATDWISSIADEGVRNWTVAKGFKDPAAVAQSAWNLEKLAGAPPESIVKLPKGDDAAEWGPIYDRLGRPQNHADYALPVPEGVDKGFAEAASAEFHKHGLNIKQAQGITKWFNEATAAQVKAHTDAVAVRNAEGIKALTTKWGSQMQANTAVVDRAAQAFGLTTEHLDGLKAAMGAAGAMEFLFTIGSKVGTDDTFIAGQGANGGATTPEAARAEIARLKGDKAFAQQFMSPDPVVRKEARDKMERLNKAAYPV